MASENGPSQELDEDEKLLDALSRLDQGPEEPESREEQIELISPEEDPVHENPPSEDMPDQSGEAEPGNSTTAEKVDSPPEEEIEEPSLSGDSTHGNENGLELNATRSPRPNEKIPAGDPAGDGFSFS